MKIAFLYARVSTDEQAKKDLSVPFQVARIEEYAAAHGYVIPDDGKFLDEGQSGNSMKRPGIKRLLASVAEGAPAAVLYLDEDRWTRNYDGFDVRQGLREQGVRCVETSSGNGDTDDYLAVEQAEEMKGFTSRDQLRKLYQIIPARMKDAVARGGPPIGGKVPLGYVRKLSIVDDKLVAKLVPDPVTAPLIAEAFKLFAEGASSRGVANFLISHGMRMLPANVRRVFQNTRYTGANVVGKKRVKKRRTGTSVTRMDPSTWTTFEGAHEPIVDRELFDRVQARLVTGSITSTRTREQHPENPFPQGLVRCAKCGSNIEFHKSQKGNYLSYTFTCRRRRERGAAHDDIGCAGSISVERLRRKVLAHISYLMQGDTLRDMFASYKRKPNPEIRRFENLAKAAAKRRDNLLDAIENAEGSTLTLVQQMEKRVAEIEEAERSLHLLRAVEPATVDPAAIRTDARSIAQSLLKMDNVKARSLIGHVFSEIRVDFGAAAALRDADRTLKATFRNKTDAEIFEARVKAAQIVDKIQWSVGGDVTFAYTWGGPTLTGAENLLNMAEGRYSEVSLGKKLPDDIVAAAATHLK